MWQLTGDYQRRMKLKVRRGGEQNRLWVLAEELGEGGVLAVGGKRLIFELSRDCEVFD